MDTNKEKDKSQKEPENDTKTYLIDFTEDPRFAPLTYLLGQYLPISGGIQLANDFMGFEGILVVIDMDERGIFYEFES